MNPPKLYTLGHSNRTLDEFFAILHAYKIKQLIDVRRHPQSRRYPSFNRNTLSLAIEDENIAYVWLGHELGGMRREKPDSPHSALAPSGFRGFADHMSSGQFQNGIRTLTQLGNKQAIVIICAERDPGQCHRSMIADYLTLHGWGVTHLLSINQISTHTLNPLARDDGNQPVYDGLGQEQLDLKL